VYSEIHVELEYILPNSKELKLYKCSDTKSIHRLWFVLLHFLPPSSCQHPRTLLRRPFHRVNKSTNAKSSTAVHYGPWRWVPKPHREVHCYSYCFFVFKNFLKLESSSDAADASVRGASVSCKQHAFSLFSSSSSSSSFNYLHQTDCSTLRWVSSKGHMA
jgi:hypothetical protein